jgi:Carboxypeptidase regulatory-like domain/TonB-dependent Receptor Plug Domain/TonB dependent receptor
MLIRSTRSLKCFLAFCLFLALTMTASAQSSQGILAGVVRDTTGAVIPNVKVTVTNEATHEVRATVSKGDGAYRVDAIPPGTYTVVVEQPGFDTHKATGVIVTPSMVSSYDATMSIGKVSDVVEVQAVSNSINTENGQLTGILSVNDIQELPIFSLNPIELATTLPGVQVIIQPGSGAGAQGQVFSANGARPRANNFLIDGQEINDVAIAGQGFQPDIPGMFSNVAVLTNSASAEYGRAGGAVTNVVTARGSNTFHGTAFERYTGSGLNALSGTQRQSKPVLAAQNPPTFPQKTRFNRHTYGFTAGGPIFKNKLFAFGAGQWQRFFGGTLEGRTDLPDAAGVAALQAIQAAGGSQGTQAALFGTYLSNYSYLKTFQNTSPVNKPFESLIVNANGCPTTGCIVTTGLFQRPTVAEQNTDTQFATRVDYTASTKDSIAVRYIHDRSTLSPDFGNNASLPGFDSKQGGYSELAQVSEVHVWGPRVLNEFRVSETRLNFLFAFTDETVANPLSHQPTLSFGGNSLPNLGPNQNLPQGRGEDLYQVQDTVGLSFSKHTIRAGFDIGRQIEQEFVSQNALGQLNYATGSFGSSVGEFINNFIGTSGSVTRTFGNTRVDPHNWRTGLFIQDDIKLTPELTVNLGARYDFFSAPENNVAFPAIHAATALTDPINAVFKITTDKNNISPRAGFAYVPHFGFFSDGKTVFHGGFGIYFDGDFSNLVVNEVQSSPNAIAYSQTYNGADGAPNSNTLLALAVPVLTPLSSVQTMVDNLVNPYTYQYNFGIERELPFNLKLTTNYVGSRGVKLFENRQYNYNTTSNGTAATPRINAARGPINARGNFATSEYNSLQAELSRSFSHGLTFRAAYTLGKDLDNGSEVFNTFNSATSYQADLSASGLTREWGNSAWDHRNNVTISYVWSPSGFRADNAMVNGFLGALTRHWTVSGVERFQSGPYTTLSVSGVDTNKDGSTANDRAVISNPSAPFMSAAIDASYFSVNKVPGIQGTYIDAVTFNGGTPGVLAGTQVLVDPTTKHFLVQRGQNFLSQEVGRDTFLQPGYQQHDIALEKGIGLSYLKFERGQLTLRVEANDVGNHNNVAPLAVNPFLFGQSSQLNPVIARTVSSRSLVLWAKVKF